jgi:hypothetical protein
MSQYYEAEQIFKQLVKQTPYQDKLHLLIALKLIMNVQGRYESMQYTKSGNIKAKERDIVDDLEEITTNLGATVREL